MRKIKVNIKKVIIEISKFGSFFMSDIFAGFYTEKEIFEKYKKFNNEEIYQQFIFKLIKIILENRKGAEEILLILSKDLSSYIESFNYNNKNINELEKEFNAHMCNSLHGCGTSPEEMLFYFFSKNIFQGEKVEFCIEIYRKFEKELAEEYKEINRNISEKINISALSYNEKIKFLDFVDENLINLEEKVFEKIETELNVNYDLQKKIYNNVPRGMLLYIYNGLKEREKEEEEINYMYNMLIKNYIHIEKEKEKIKVYYDNNAKLKYEIKKQKKEIEENKKEIAFLNSLIEKIRTESQRDIEKEYQEKEKENYYLKTQIEKLQIELQEMSSEKEKVKIEENIEIEELKEIEPKREKPAYSNIIIAGGKWNEKEKESVIAFLDTNEIKFIAAEDIIKNRYKIKKADYIIFDTSFNAHKNYKLCKSETEILHINKSSLEEIKKNFN